METMIPSLLYVLEEDAERIKREAFKDLRWKYRSHYVRGRVDSALPPCPSKDDAVRHYEVVAVQKKLFRKLL